MPLNQADFTTTFYGVGIEVKNQVVKISGTPTDNISIMIGKNGVVFPTDNSRITFQLKSGTYKFTQFITGSATTNVDVRLKDENTNIFYKTGASITLTETHTFTINILILGTDNKNAEIKVQLEEGSSASEYEEHYNYELARIPNTNYQDYLYKTSGKNLYNDNAETEAYYYNASGEKVASPSSSETYINLEYNLSDTAITITRATIVGGANIRVCEYNGNTFIKRTLTNATSETIVLDSNTTKVIFSINKSSSAYFTNLMINIGSTALPYEPYGSDKWYKKEYIYKIANKTNWSVDNVASNNRAVISLSGNGFPYSSDIGYASANAISNNFIGISQLNQASTTEINNIAVNNANMYIKFADTINTTALVKTQLDSMTSLEIYYVVATPNDIEITNTTLIEQLDNLEKLKSYNGVTNINCSGNLSAILGVSAIKGES